MAEFDGKIRIKTELDNTSFNNQIKETEKTLATQKKSLEKIKNAKPYAEQQKDINNYQLEIEKTTNKLNKLYEKQLKVSLGRVSNINYNQNNSLAGGFSIKGSYASKASGISDDLTDWQVDNVKDLGNAFEETGEKGEEAGDKAGNSFSNMGKKLTKVGIALFGVRTAFSIFTRASNAYLSQHTETAAKIQSIWTALGNALGPIIEAIATGILKVIGYLNAFVKAFTNGKVDLTANMNNNTKAINGTTAAMKELNKQTYKFDEMTIEQDNSSSSGGGSSGGIGDIASFEMPELDPGILKFMEDLGTYLRENWDWIWKVGAALGVVFGVAKISGLLSNIGKLIGGAGSGLLGMKSVLGWLLAIGLIMIEIKLITNFAEEMGKLRETNKGVKDFAEQNTKELKRVNEENEKLAKSYEKGSQEIERYVNGMKSEYESAKDVIAAKQKENSEMSITDNMLDVIGGTREKNHKLMKESVARIIDVVSHLQNLAKEEKLTDEQTQLYNEAMGYLQETYKTMGPMIDTNSFLYDKETKALSLQIEELQKNEKQFGITTSKNKENATSLWQTITNKFFGIDNVLKTSTDKANSNIDTTKSKLNDLANTKSEPQVNVKVNTSKLSSTLEAMNNSSFLSGLGLTAGLSSTILKLRSIGMDHGGIFNLPGRGVPIGYDVVTGEKRREGVLPLEDPGTMQQLGYEIGKNVNVNLTNNNYLGNRLISRETKKVSNQNGYLTNGRVM